jgi:hypothetical protein
MAAPRQELRAPEAAGRDVVQSAILKPKATGPREIAVPYKPSRTKAPKKPVASGSMPSWQVPTDPEPRWLAFGTAIGIIAGQTWVANDLSLRPVWVLPVVSAALLLASLAVYLPDHEEPSLLLRRLAISLTAVLIAGNAISVLYLIRGVFMGSGLDPLGLLLTGLVLWVVNTATFALAFWEFDGNGPEQRSDGCGDYPDFVFPQQQQDQQGLAPADWKPTFLDYLYVSLTAATAFSPTDTMPYTKRAKLLMGAESTIAFAIAAMVVARSINIAKG